MTQETIKAKFEELKMTKDEMDRFGEAMKKEEFRKLLVEYAEEISDPKNRELYEKEITMLEQERGQNVIFVHPEAGFCMKTIQNGNLKCFINICKNENVDKPTSKRQTKNINDKKSEGLVWYIPHTCSPGREDYDKSGETPCIVYDVVFNPDSYRMAETNDRFKNLLKNSAMDTIEKNFNVKLDRSNVKILKHLNFKGRPTATVLRRPAEGESTKQTSNDELIKPLIDQIKQNNLDKELEKRLNAKQNTNNQTQETEVSDSPKYTTPSYKIVHRGQTDMQDFANDLSNRFVSSTRPKELSINIELPLCKSSQNVLLDIFETRLHLEAIEPNYKLDLNLPFPVREKEAKAKFDKTKRCLNVLLPVVPFVSKIDDDYYPPSPSCSSCSSLSASSSPTSDMPFDNQDVQVPTPSQSPTISPNNQTINNSVKYSLPDCLSFNETNKYIYLKVKITSYVKDSVQINFDSESALNIKCESCSSHGSFIKFYSAFISFSHSTDFIHSDLLINSSSIKDSDLFNIDYIDDENFEIKIRKSANCLNEPNKQAYVLLNKDSLDKLTININQILDQNDVNNNNPDKITENMNNLSKKDFILNFKNNAENHDLDEDDDDDDDDTDNDIDENAISHNPSLKQIIYDKNVLREKIEEEPELTDSNNMTDSCEECEKDYLKSQANEANEDDDDDEEDDDEVKKENNEPMSLSSSSTNFSNDSSTLAGRLKSILKKPRSFSESESNMASLLSQRHSISNCLRNSYGSSDCNSNSESLNDMSSIKKSVSFNKQVIRNVFKPGSTVNGMKKPNSKKNNKKNKRKRTVSDPSSDASPSAQREMEANMRPRNMSESSDDNSSQSNSVQFFLSEENVSNQQDVKIADSKSVDQKKKKNNKKKKGKSNDENKPANKTDNGGQEAKNPLDLETMISWKNQGRLSNENPHKTNCSFKFKNKLINDLDD